ncbi:hypothetical protein DAH66_02150 [Sphingomonas koreensis]|uniref:PRC-barrel domain-containing protein n=2 Tax=Sphingomonadaceae TaxID=41297 RepID=A0A430G7U8_9SPHN|nr:MAG: hypothetical protein CVT77_03935 [Alphaproteobacteria bacterium HGW-Alphaproteobacteria-16]PZU59933.1 MAG: hypothetical protein DI547_05540 [Sphingobium sp.]RSY89484.1 hypothetical protein DAH66_02150 [Sphingomonas koreensis]
METDQTMKPYLTCMCAALLFAAPVQALAAQAAPAATIAVKKNQTIIDADGRVLGKVYEVNDAGGFVTFTAQMKVYRVPISTLSAEGARLKTSLTRKAIGL